VAAGAAAFAAPAIVRGRNLNEKLNVAIIGSGGRGNANLNAIGGGNKENIVALCDVAEKALDSAAARYPDARKVTDFRKLFDQYQKEFDAVVVSTCEHTHAFATLPALQLGKHVYCEKPLTYNIQEARIIREAAAKAKVATQMGTQNHANPNYRQVVELIHSGAIGHVKEAHVWVSRAWGWQSEAEAREQKDRMFMEGVFVQDRPKQADPIPAGLDWELWLGPAPYRPFSNAYYPGPRWYRWWDFGNGTMSDLGSHWNDLPFWALKLNYPLTIEAFGPPPHPEIAPASMRAVYEFGQRGDLPPVQLTWHQGTSKPQIWTDGGIPQYQNGVLFIGEKGMLLSDYGKHVLLPEKQFEGFQRPEPFLSRPASQHAEWIEACKTGSPTGSNFEYAGWLTETNHLGNVAYRAGKKLQWDPVNLRASNAPEAQPFIQREYRNGWKLV
jgi:predicted dehydrogenase